MKNGLRGLIALLILTVLWISSCGKSTSSIVGGEELPTVDTTVLYLSSTFTSPAGKPVGTPFLSNDTATDSVFAYWDVAKKIPASGVTLTVVSTLPTGSTSTKWVQKSSVVTDNFGRAAVRVSCLIAASSNPIEELLQVTFSGTGKRTETSTTASVKFTSSQLDANPNIFSLDAASLTLSADGKSKTTIAASYKNSDNNPIAGKTVRFVTNAGSVTALGITDSLGIATATLISDRRNHFATVRAFLATDTSTKAIIPVEFTGVKITTTNSLQSIIPNGLDTATIIAVIKDASGAPIYNEGVTYSTKKGSTLTKVSADTVTSTTGKITCKVVGSIIPGSAKVVDTLVIIGGGDTLNVPVNYSSNTLAFAPVAAPNMANGTDTTTVTVQYLEADQKTGIAGAKLFLSATSGKVVSADTITNSLGWGTIRFVNPDFATKVTITASAITGAVRTNDSIAIDYTSGPTQTIELNGTPEVIRPGGEKAQLTAIVKDSRGNRVKGTLVSFHLLNGPGAGEKLSPPTAITDESGVATTSFVSGSSTSGQQGIQVIARTSNGKVSDTIPLTISGAPKSVRFTYNISKVKAGAGGTYSMECAAIVSDENGNVVQDSLPVMFSLEITGYYCYKMIPDTTGKLIPISTLIPVNTPENPISAVLIKKQVATKEGQANNTITYGMSDALRLQVTVWAEVKGITSSKQEIQLPILEDDYKYFRPLDTGGYNCN